MVLVVLICFSCKAILCSNSLKKNNEKNLSIVQIQKVTSPFYNFNITTIKKTMIILNIILYYIPSNCRKRNTFVILGQLFIVSCRPSFRMRKIKIPSSVVALPSHKPHLISWCIFRGERNEVVFELGFGFYELYSNWGSKLSFH